MEHLARALSCGDRSQKNVGHIVSGPDAPFEVAGPHFSGFVRHPAQPGPQRAPGFCVQRPPCFDPVLPSSFYVLRQTQRHVHGSEFSLSELRTTFPTADASMLVRSGKEAARPYLKGDIMRSAWRETTVAERILCAGSLTSGLPDQKGSVGFPLGCCAVPLFPRGSNMSPMRDRP